MAVRFRRLTAGECSGAAAALVVAGLLLVSFLAVVWRADGLSALTLRDLSAVRFTVVQAVLSALLSVLVAIPLAGGLARRSFRGRRLLITLMGAPFILPVIVAILGLLAVYGRSGLLGQSVSFFGLEPPSIYGLQGILLAHVFFNLPLATRMILHGWQAIPTEHFRLAASLGFDNSAVWRNLEAPMLRRVLPGVFLVIFLICTTSFTVALALGGGPRATTVELAIYQAFRFDFDLGRAALLGLVQVAICVLAVATARAGRGSQTLGKGLNRVVPLNGVPVRWIDFPVIALAALFLLLPLVMILLTGAPRIFALPGVVYWSASRSVAVAFASIALTLALALPLAFVVARAPRRISVTLDGIGMLPIALSPLVLGIGLYLMLLHVANPLELALPVTAIVNAVVSLPFVLRTLVPSMRSALEDYGRLSASLGIEGSAFLRYVLLPRIRKPLGFGAGLAGALSMGDLGVIALFGSPDGGTLPLALYRLMGSYRMEDAAGAAVLLLALSLGIFWLFDSGGRGDSEI